VPVCLVICVRTEVGRVIRWAACYPTSVVRQMDGSQLIMEFSVLGIAAESFGLKARWTRSATFRLMPPESASSRPT
jgi:hypothetical protein